VEGRQGGWKERRESGKNAWMVDGTHACRVVGKQRGWKDSREGGRNAGRVEGMQGED